ncbi:uncharacterized protein LOC62_01G001084 [Vanrija pseudolonga]|uniref:Uncharacterized protein n=1 Tax=Vanrija pseudolonga TaxID=143232 RepID=A0AAF0Y4H3_9TREE|nr:hypothetical protein LOC62_01G001084 [Vanrija pseudolonga]
MGFQPLRRKASDSRAILKLPVHLTCELNNETARREPEYAETIISEFVRCNTPKWAFTAKRRASSRRVASGKLEEVEREFPEFANEFRSVRSRFHLPAYTPPHVLTEQACAVVKARMSVADLARIEADLPPLPESPVLEAAPTPIAEAMAKLTSPMPAHRRADSDAASSAPSTLTPSTAGSDTLTTTPYLDLAFVPFLSGDDDPPRSWRDARACSVYLPRDRGSRALPVSIGRAIASRA